MRNKGLPKATSFLLLAIYEVIVAFLFVVYTFSFSTSGGALSVRPDPSQESIWLVLLFFAPLLLSHTSRLSLPFFGGSATIEFKEMHERIQEQVRRVEELSNSTELYINALTGHLVVDPRSNPITKQYAEKRLESGELLIACRDFTEQRVLGALYKILLEENGFAQVKLIPDYRPAALIFLSLLRGDIDIYPGYTWTGFEIGLDYSLHRVYQALYEMDGPEAVDELNRIYGQAPEPLTWLAPLGFADNWEIIMTGDDAAERGIERVSDLRDWNGQLTFGCEREFYERVGGYRVLHQPAPLGYGITFNEIRFFRREDIYDALSDEEVDVIDGFSTDDRSRSAYSMLDDDEKRFGTYFAAPVVRSSVLDRFPTLQETMEELHVTDEEVRTMHRKIGKRGGDLQAVERVAHRFLYRKGLIPGKAQRRIGSR